MRTRKTPHTDTSYAVFVSRDNGKIIVTRQEMPNLFLCECLIWCAKSTKYYVAVVPCY